MSEEPRMEAPEVEVPSGSFVGRAVLVVVCVALVMGAAVLLYGRTGAEQTRLTRERSDRRDRIALGPRVMVTQIALSAPQRELIRVGDARPFVEASMYAKVSGYLREVRVDRGMRVRRGDVLATIDVPESGPQIRAARADVANRRAIATRARGLVAPGIVSQQDADVAATSAELADATARLLTITRGYGVLRAPFDGVVTARFADPGALVQAATGSQTGALPIVRISDVDHLRVFIYLDQRDATFVHVGDSVKVRVRERPGAELAATISRIAGELDPRTRTMLVEVDVDNHAGFVAPGGYVDVALRIDVDRWPEVPAEALVMRGPRRMLAGVENGVVHLVPIEVVDDDGTLARVRGPVAVGQTVALSLPDEVPEGGRVQPVQRPREPRR